MASLDDREFTGVQLIVAQLVEPPIVEPLQRLLDLVDEPWLVKQTAVAWADVRGLDGLAAAIERTVPPSPDTGYSAVINQPHRLLVYARWHWAGVNIMADLHLS